MEDVPERVGLIEVAAGTEDDEFDDSMSVDHAAEVDEPADEQLLVLVVSNQDVRQANVIMNSLLGDCDQNGKDFVELCLQACNDWLQRLIDKGVILVKVGIEATDIEEMPLTFLLDLRAKAFNARTAQKKRQFSCDVSSLVEQVHWRILNLPHQSPLDKSHYPYEIVTILIAFHQHIFPIQRWHQSRNLAPEVNRLLSQFFEDMVLQQNELFFLQLA